MMTSTFTPEACLGLVQPWLSSVSLDVIMLIFARILRVVLGAVVVLAFLCAARGVWIGIEDYHMQTREHWQFRCGYVQFVGTVFAIGSILVGAASFVAFRKTTAWTHRLHGSSNV